jgi:hypothetical protein
MFLEDSASHCADSQRVRSDTNAGNECRLRMQGRPKLQGFFLRQHHGRMCFTGDGKVVFYKAGSYTPFSYDFDINNDGTLQTPLGAIKKMGN